MTSTPVMDIGRAMTYNGETGGILPTGGGDFMGELKAAMETQSGSMNNPKSDIVSATANTSSKKTPQVEKSHGEDRLENKKNEVKADAKETGRKTVKTESNEKEVTSEQIETVGTKAQEVVTKVAEEMDVAPEEVLEAMETLGLTMIDLLDPSNMTDLVAEISGNQDVISLLTDENLYQTLENLQGFVNQITEDLSKELDLSQEALNTVLEQAEELLKQTVTTDADLDSTVVNSMADENTPLEGMKDFKTTVVVDGQEVTMNVEVDDSTGAQVATVERTDLNQSENKGSSKENMNSGDSDKDNAHGSESLITQTTQFNNIDAPDFGQMTNQVESFNSQANDIANQILESMKATLKPEMTELEMNLHPASLGNVRVSLTAQNGQITAQFIAQNETVRAAIESQVAQLTNQLEDQGIKVERVEVAIADYKFDQGTNNGNPEENQSSNGSAGKAKSGRVRRIDMSGIDDIEELEELDESDRIAADMMIKNGNTVDYTV